MHRVPEGLRRAELLHPDGRPVAERIDGVVFGQRVVAEDGAPERDVDVGGLRRDRDPYFLDGAPVGDDAYRRSDPGHGVSELDVLRLDAEDTAGQPHVDVVGGDNNELPLRTSSNRSTAPSVMGRAALVLRLARNSGRVEDAPCGDP